MIVVARIVAAVTGDFRSDELTEISVQAHFALKFFAGKP
jgi:hypothetical protein